MKLKKIIVKVKENKSECNAKSIRSTWNNLPEPSIVIT